VVLSTLGVAVAAAGLVVGVLQLQTSRDGRHGRTRLLRVGQDPIPYTGAMRWHHLTGLFFGVFTLTWVFSGLLSMEPYAWTRAEGLRIPAAALSGGGIDTTTLAVMNPLDVPALSGGRVIREVEFRRIQGDPYFLISFDPREQFLVAAESLTIRRIPFTVESIQSRLQAAAPDADIIEVTTLERYDAYYYARDDERPLPVLRFRFGDPLETWMYVDPATSRIVASVHQWGRVERWLYRGLHSLDFAFWYDRRPLWDIGLIVLSLGGLASSGLGAWMGGRRVVRWLRSVVVGRAA
jgi:hypothetical protein